MPALDGYDLRNGEQQGPTFLTIPGFAPVLRAAGVHDAVAASTAAVAPDRHALSALLSLWHPGSHAFRLPAGPATFSLEDALLLAGLAPSGAPLDRPLTPTEQDIRARLVVEKE
uniref:Aminotransferase-like plant mobile domain-containing protein n=1 Tax=Aegilops tauschii subsp. strangulata TaxID=200361 RepID=A0A453GFX3_AEGTS